MQKSYLNMTVINLGTQQIDWRWGKVVVPGNCLEIVRKYYLNHSLRAIENQTCKSELE